MPTQEQAEKAWKHGNKGKQYYDAMTEEQKKAMWQYGYDRKLVDTSRLGPGAKAEYQKYVNPDKPEYAMQASIVEKPKQYIQTQNEKITSAITPGIVKNMLGQTPEQIAAKKPIIDNIPAKRIGGRSLENIEPDRTIQTLTGKAGIKVPVTQNKTMIPVGKAGILKVPARQGNALDKAIGNVATGAGKLALNTLSTVNSVLQTPATVGKYGTQEMNKAKAEGKNPAIGLLKGYGTGVVKAITNQDAAENTEVLEGIAPKSTEALKQKFPNAYKAASTVVNLLGVDDLTAIGLIGDIAKVRKLNSGINTTADLVKMSQAGIKDAPKVAKVMQENPDIVKAVDNLDTAELNDYFAYIDYMDEVNRKTPEYIKSEARLNVPKAKNIKTALQDVEVKPQMQGKGKAYRVANTNYDKAVQEYDNAIEAIQNYYGTNELRVSEYDKIKSELGIDIEKLVANMENAQAPSVSNIGNRERLKAASGLKTLPDLAKVETVPQQVKLDRPILSALDARVNKPYDAPISKAVETPIKPISEVKPLSNINTLPIENKPLKGASKPLKNNVPSNAAKTVKEAVSKAPTKKDISGFQAYTTDVYRNFEQVFGEDYPAVKRDILYKFDEAKKAKTIEDRQLMGDLKQNVVDKFNIQKGSKHSALTQQFGEKRLSLESLIDKVGKKKADEIVEADKYFRSTYDRIIDEVNEARAITYPNDPSKIIPKRKDYYRHFKELSDDFAGLKNIFETPSQISPSLAGTSEFTKPKSKFLSFAQKRGDGKFTDDAVGGFLDYINAATYAKHIDTQIPNFRGLAADLAETTEQSKNMNNFIGYLTDFSNDLAGKTNPADRFAQKIIPGGRTTFKAINWLNSRVKANTVLGNLSSTLSQIANVPQGIAYVKNPVHLTKGAGNFMGSIFGKGDAALYKKSGFLLERYADNVARQFDVKILDQPKKAAAWMLGALDEVGTKFIWSSTYQKALADGIKEPIKHADDITRKMVAGRGIGEVPLLQKSKIMQLVAPFTIEVNNLWKVQKDFVKAGDFGGLALLYLANFVLNRGMEEIRGNGVVFDPINAIAEASGINAKQEGFGLNIGDDSLQLGPYKLTKTNEKMSPLERAGRLGGEVLSNMPLGSTAASLYPEYGINNEFINAPTREKLFGRNDPTRFGGGLLVAKGLQDPLYKIAPSFGGGQIKKTVQAGQDLKILPKLKKQENNIIPKLKKQDLSASYSNTKAGDKMRTTIDPKPSSIAKGLMFGRGAIPEVKKYYESGKTPLGTKQTENIQKLIKKGYDPNKLFEALNGIRGTNKKADIVVKLRENGYNDKQINEIWEIFYK
jgi:hypothetical protein